MVYGDDKLAYEPTLPSSDSYVADKAPASFWNAQIFLIIIHILCMLCFSVESFRITHYY